MQASARFEILSWRRDDMCRYASVCQGRVECHPSVHIRKNGILCERRNDWRRFASVASNDISQLIYVKKMSCVGVVTKSVATLGVFC
jgi:hypothetical protein